MSARALPLNRLSGNLSPRLASAVGGAAAVTPSQRVSHQSGLTLPALKSARTHALAAALNLSPRMLQRELRAPADKGRLDGAAHATLVASMLRSTGKLRGRPAVDGGAASASAASLPTPQPPATPRVLGGGTPRAWTRARREAAEAATSRKRSRRWKTWCASTPPSNRHSGGAAARGGGRQAAAGEPPFERRQRRRGRRRRGRGVARRARRSDARAQRSEWDDSAAAAVGRA